MVGQTNYSYEEVTNLLEYETVYYENYYFRHHYLFQNDSILIGETYFNGVDSSTRTYIVNITGTNHLVSSIRFPGRRYIYTYNGEQLSTAVFTDSLKSVNFNFSGGDCVAYNYRDYNPLKGGWDTIYNTLSYTTRAYQAGINYLPFIQEETLSQQYPVLENRFNLELAGCGFNLHQYLVQSHTFGTISHNYVVNYTYTFDNAGRISSKSYTDFGSITPNAIRVDYEYFN